MVNEPLHIKNVDCTARESNNSDTDHVRNDDQWSPAALEKAGSALKALNRMAKRPPVHINFEDVGMSVNKGDRQILRNVTGEFRSGELACIIGPSGAGKSTLLNVLSGYIQNNTGKITINGQIRDMKVFKKLSSYIMQDDLLQNWITVGEYMKIAADLKLGKELGKAEKNLIIEEILQTLGLWKHKDTMSQFLSGGQLKRLSIALELVNNPPVIFLDEPTTGLDIVSVRHLVVLLRLLCSQGRTIICTIHQPSASLFSLFHRVYILADGMCCYQGSSSFLVPYLAEVGHVCPTNHNPADFVLETLYSPAAVSQMSQKCCNGKKSQIQHTPPNQRNTALHSDMSIQQLFTTHVAKTQMQEMEFPTTFMTQLIILLKRLYLQTKRDNIQLWLQITHHVLSSLVIGVIFLGSGNDAQNPVVIVKYAVCIQVFFMFTHSMVPVLRFPMEIKVLHREHFNQWYSINAYYAAKTISTLPTLIGFGTIFIFLTYVMTDQPLEWNRFFWFSCCSILTGLCSEGIGLFFGSTCRPTNGAILGPAVMAPFLALACYGFGFGQSIEPFMKYLMNASFVRLSLSGQCLSLFSNRKPLECSSDLCLYRNPELFLRDMGMEKDIFIHQMLSVATYATFIRVLGYIALNIRIVKNRNSKILSCFTRVIRR